MTDYRAYAVARLAALLLPQPPTPPAKETTMRHLDETTALHNAALTRLEAHASIGGPAVGRDLDGNEYAWPLTLERAARLHYAVATELTGDTWEAWPAWWTWPGGATEPSAKERGL